MSFQRSGGPRFIQTPPPNVTQRPTHVITSDEHPLTLSIIAILPNGEMQSSTIHPSLREDVMLVPVTDISCGTTKGKHLQFARAS